MKIDLTGKLSKGKQRTLNTFRTAFSELIQKKPFESITVTELCDLCLIPKSTFYNYFDDIYDLLNYYSSYSRAEILRSYDNAVMYDLKEAVRNTAAFILQHKSVIRRILRHNLPTGAMYVHYQKYMYEALLRIYRKFPELIDDDFPIEIHARISASVLMCLIDWFVNSENGISESEMAVIMVRNLYHKI